MLAAPILARDAVGPSAPTNSGMAASACQQWFSEARGVSTPRFWTVSEFEHAGATLLVVSYFG